MTEQRERVARAERRCDELEGEIEAAQKRNADAAAAHEAAIAKAQKEEDALRDKLRDAREQAANPPKVKDAGASLDMKGKERLARATDLNKKLNGEVDDLQRELKDVKRDAARDREARDRAQADEARI